MDGVVGKMGYYFVQKIGPNTVPDMIENPDCIKIQEYIEINPPIFPNYPQLNEPERKMLPSMLVELSSESCRDNRFNADVFITMYNKLRDNWQSNQDDWKKFLKKTIQTVNPDQLVPTTNTVDWESIWNKIYNKVQDRLRVQIFRRWS